MYRVAAGLTVNGWNVLSDGLLRSWWTYESTNNALGMRYRRRDGMRLPRRIRKDSIEDA